MKHHTTYNQPKQNTWSDTNLNTLAYFSPAPKKGDNKKEGGAKNLLTTLEELNKHENENVLDFRKKVKEIYGSLNASEQRNLPDDIKKILDIIEDADQNSFSKMSFKKISTNMEYAFRYSLGEAGNGFEEIKITKDDILKGMDEYMKNEDFKKKIAKEKKRIDELSSISNPAKDIGIVNKKISNFLNRENKNDNDNSLLLSDIVASINALRPGFKKKHPEIMQLHNKIYHGYITNSARQSGDLTAAIKEMDKWIKGTETKTFMLQKERLPLAEIEAISAMSKENRRHLPLYIYFEECDISEEDQEKILTQLKKDAIEKEYNNHKSMEIFEKNILIENTFREIMKKNSNPIPESSEALVNLVHKTQARMRELSEEGSENIFTEDFSIYMDETKIRDIFFQEVVSEKLISLDEEIERLEVKIQKEVFDKEDLSKESDTDTEKRIELLEELDELYTRKEKITSMPEYKNSIEEAESKKKEFFLKRYRNNTDVIEVNKKDIQDSWENIDPAERMAKIQEEITKAESITGDLVAPEKEALDAIKDKYSKMHAGSPEDEMKKLYVELRNINISNDKYAEKQKNAEVAKVNLEQNIDQEKSKAYTKKMFEVLLSGDGKEKGSPQMKEIIGCIFADNKLLKMGMEITEEFIRYLFGGVDNISFEKQDDIRAYFHKNKTISGTFAKMRNHIQDKLSYVEKKEKIEKSIGNKYENQIEKNNKKIEDKKKELKKRQDKFRNMNEEKRKRQRLEKEDPEIEKIEEEIKKLSTDVEADNKKIEEDKEKEIEKNKKKKNAGFSDEKEKKAYQELHNVIHKKNTKDEKDKNNKLRFPLTLSFFTPQQIGMALKKFYDEFCEHSKSTDEFKSDYILGKFFLDSKSEFGSSMEKMIFKKQLTYFKDKYEKMGIGYVAKQIENRSEDFKSRAALRVAAEMMADDGSFSTSWKMFGDIIDAYPGTYPKNYKGHNFHNDPYAYLDAMYDEGGFAASIDRKFQTAVSGLRDASYKEYMARLESPDPGETQDSIIEDMIRRAEQGTVNAHQLAGYMMAMRDHKIGIGQPVSSMDAVFHRIAKAQKARGKKSPINQAFFHSFVGKNREGWPLCDFFIAVNGSPEDCEAAIDCMAESPTAYVKFKSTGKKKTTPLKQAVDRISLKGMDKGAMNKKSTKEASAMIFFGDKNAFNALMSQIEGTLGTPPPQDRINDFLKVVKKIKNGEEWGGIDWNDPEITKGITEAEKFKTLEDMLDYKLIRLCMVKSYDQVIGEYVKNIPTKRRQEIWEDYDDHFFQTRKKFIDKKCSTPYDEDFDGIVTIRDQNEQSGTANNADEDGEDIEGSYDEED